MAIIEINHITCNRYEYPEPVEPVNSDSGYIVSVVDSLESITNPDSDHIYIVDGSSYVYSEGEFVQLNACGSGEWTTDGVADGSEPNGDLVITSATISDSALRYRTGIESVTLTNLVNTNSSNCFQGCTGLTSFSAPLMETCGAGFLADCSALTSVSFPLLEKPGNVMLQGTLNLKEIWLPKVTEIPYPFVNGRAPNQSTANSVLKLGSTVTSIHSNAFGGFAVSGDIYVPWSQGDIAGEPWGAGSNIVIHYDTVYDADGNVISST